MKPTRIIAVLIASAMAAFASADVTEVEFSASQIYTGTQDVVHVAFWIDHVAPPGGTIVAIRCDNPNYLKLPPKVVVPEGNSSFGFDITAPVASSDSLFTKIYLWEKNQANPANGQLAIYRLWVDSVGLDGDYVPGTYARVRVSIAKPAANDTAVEVRSSSPFVTFNWSDVGKAVIKKGQTSVIVPGTAAYFAKDAVFTATIPSTRISAWTPKLRPKILDITAVEFAPSPVKGGKALDFQVTLNAWPWIPEVVQLQLSSNAFQFATYETVVVDAPGVGLELTTKPTNVARTGKITVSLPNGNKKVVTVTINP